MFEKESLLEIYAILLLKRFTNYLSLSKAVKEIT